MPRHKSCENANTYHYKVKYNDSLEGEKEKLLKGMTKLFLIPQIL